jgi:hypothetical protein
MLNLANDLVIYPVNLGDLVPLLLLNLTEHTSSAAAFSKKDELLISSYNGLSTAS